MRNLKSSYTDKFWSVKKKLDDEQSSLRLAIEGFRGSKAVFMQKIMSEKSSNTSELLERPELEQLCDQLFSGNAEKVQILDIPSFDSLLALEKKEILQKIIVGKEDVNISKLIKKLDNDGWFKQGISYVKNSDGRCPFCQRPLEQDFMDKVSEYFDQSYLTAEREITNINNEYDCISKDLSSKISTLIDDSSGFVKSEELKEAYGQFASIIEINKRRMLEKKTSLNIVTHLDSIEGVATRITQILNEANTAIAQYNSRIDNIKTERNALTSKVWRYILDTVKNDIDAFLDRKKDLNELIKKAEAQIEDLTQKINDKKRERRSLEQSLTSVLPTADGINLFLKNYGITSFSLKVNEEDKTYQFVRENGEPALESLSEGERNFVTFLYFMYSLQGSIEKSGHNDNKIVIVDDPVSRLDSDVLLVVSSLLRDLFKNIYSGEGAIKQLFVLSHNSFFFKEVSYKQGLNKKKTGYWMIKKENNRSNIVNYEENPVNSTYEMLWDEVREAKLNPTESNTLSLANTMRRILEHYFSLLGGVDLSKLHLNFPEGERQVFKSLISWANAGSHSAFDDYSATPNLYGARI